MSDENALTIPGTTALLPASPDEFADEIARERIGAGESTGTPFISLRGGLFKLQGEGLGATIDVIVTGIARENRYFQSDYDPDNFTPPTCWAISAADGTMGPDPEDTGIQPESTSCDECPYNAFGSGKGRGKACSNSHRLTVIPVGGGAGADLVSAAGLYRLRVPATSMRNVTLYQSKVADVFKRPLASIVTRLRIEPHEKHQFHVELEPVAALTPEAYEAVRAREDEAETQLRLSPVVEQGAKDEETPSEDSGKY